MYKLLLLAGAGVLAAGSASAQTADPLSWTGPYAGLHVGYGFAHDKPVTDSGFTANNQLAVASGVRPNNIDVDRAGVLGGGQLGWNFQSGRMIYGVEGDFSYTSQKDGETIYSQFANPTLGAPAGLRSYVRSDLQWMATARGRLGYTLGRGMIYGTGGYAAGRVRGYADYDGASGASNYFGRHNYIASGWTAGGGLEFRPWTTGMMSKVSVKAEALYYDLGQSHIYALQDNAAAGYYTLGLHTRGYNGRIGFNYHF